MPTTTAKKKGLVLRLYVAGKAPNSVLAIANVKAICETHFAGGHTLEIVDLLKHPLMGLGDSIVVTPTLMKLQPLPVQRLIGNLSDTDRVVMALGGM